MSNQNDLFPKITEEGLELLRSRIGVSIENTAEPWCYEATRDNIRHYAHGIGDDNPLWCDPEYAAKTKYGGIIALPSFLFATNRIISGYVGGLPGVHAMWAGADWTWHKPVMRNDEISTTAYLKDLIEHQTRFAGRAFQQHAVIWQIATVPAPNDLGYVQFVHVTPRPVCKLVDGDDAFRLVTEVSFRIHLTAGRLPVTEPLLLVIGAGVLQPVGGLIPVASEAVADER